MRKNFIDNLRWMDVIWLIPYHAAQAFNTWGEGNYIFFGGNRVLSSFIVFFSPFFMPLLFLLAGISTRYALAKRSCFQYFAERVKRLLIPFLFGTLVFCPVLAYIGDKTNCGYAGSFPEHYAVFFTKWTDLSGFDGGFSVGQFWFLYFLFVISLVSLGIIVLVRRIAKKEAGDHDIPFPLICLPVIVLPFLYDLLSVGGKSFAEYLFIFLLGYYLMSDEKVMDKAEKYRYVTLAIALIAGIADVYMFLWSGKDFGVVNIAAKAMEEWFMILALMGIGKRSLDFRGGFTDYMSQRSFPYFSLHFLWIVLFQYWFADLFEKNIFLLYIVPVILSYIVTFICAEICLRIPLLRFLMGAGKKAQKKDV